jgi:DNA-binding transcriptional ArsR family regulator
MNHQLVLAALGDPSRQLILDALCNGPALVGVIATALDMGRPAVSHHLRVLKDARLVSDEADGNRRLYELNREGFAVLLHWFNAYQTSGIIEVDVT